jgi:hypothetical protein
MLRAAAARTRPHYLCAVVGLAVVLMAASVAGCASPATPTASAPGINPGAARQADLFAVVTAVDLDTLVGIDVESHAVTRLAALGQNKPLPQIGGGFYSEPPQSAVLTDPTRSKPLVWTWAVGDGTVVRELDPATGELHGVDVPGAGVLPFLADGKLAWASARFAGKPRLISADGTFEIGIPGPPSIIVPGPGPGRISAVVNVGDPNTGILDERIVVVDVAEKTVAELPIRQRYHFEGLWADDTMLVAPASVRIMPTPDDPENAESDNRVLTWTLDAGGSNPDAVAGLVRGPTLQGNSYPKLVAGGSGWIGVETGDFDHPRVEVHALFANDPLRTFELEGPSFLTAMSVSGTSLVVLQTGRVAFIDLVTGKVTPVDLGGATQTKWVGR